MSALNYSPAQVEELIARGKPTAADLVARVILSRNPRDPEAWLALARVAAALGEADASASYARIARELSPPPGLPAPAGERFVLIKAWGWGFCSDLEHVLGCLLLCEMSGRIPVTQWGGNSLFNVNPEEDAFREYFEPLSSYRVDDLLGNGMDFWPPKWREDNLRAEPPRQRTDEYSRVPALELLNRPERVVVSDFHTGVPVLVPWIRAGHAMRGMSIDEIYLYLTAKYLRPVASIRQDVEHFAAAHFTSAPLIAVHVRGGDKYLEDSKLQQKLALYPQAIDYFAQGNTEAPIFLLTDASAVVEDYRHRYGARLIATDCTRTSTEQGVHYLGHPDRRRLGVEVLRDVLLAAKCDRFVGNGSSNVSCMIHHLRPGGWPPGSWSMLGGPMLTSILDPSQFL